jgi:hypothetical protein
MAKTTYYTWEVKNGVYKIPEWDESTQKYVHTLYYYVFNEYGEDHLVLPENWQEWKKQHSRFQFGFNDYKTPKERIEWVNDFHGGGCNEIGHAHLLLHN